jgi:outer membrane protein insertion porin family
MSPLRGSSSDFRCRNSGGLSPHYNFAYTSIEAAGTTSLAVLLAAGSYSASSVGYTYTYDTRDDVILPTKGWNFALSQDVSGLGGDLKFLRSVVGIEYYHPFFFNLTGDISFSAGYISGYGGEQVPINERFFKGGPSFRGFEIAGIGPRDVVGDAALGGQLYGIGTYQVRLPAILPADYGINLSAFRGFRHFGSHSRAQQSVQCRHLHPR